MTLFLRRVAVGLAWTMAVLVVLLILFYAEEDLRGAFDWAVCQHELHAKGEILDLHQLVPPGKPEDNLRQIAALTDVYVQPQDGQHWYHDVYLGHGRYHDRPYIFPDGQATDFAAWAKFYRSLPEVHLPPQMERPSQEVLAALNQFDFRFNEIEAAVSNPKAYWLPNYANFFYQRNLGRDRLWELGEVLTLRGSAHIDNHEAEAAKKDFLLCLNMSASMTKDCTSFTYNSMASIRLDANNIIWEGLLRHAWNQAQLQEMESALASTDLLAVGKNSVRIQRACSLQITDFLERDDLSFLGRDGVPGHRQMLAPFLPSRWCPSGWWNQDRRQGAIDIQKLIDAIQPKKGTLQAQPFTQLQGSKVHSFYTPLRPVLESNADSMGEMIAKVETYRRLARLACRLEEYRIAQGHYPEKLEELPDLPAHLNQEVLSEQPLRYQRKGEGYSLYSIGWDQKDDGGVMDGDPQKGDWVWPSP